MSTRSPKDLLRWDAVSTGVRLAMGPILSHAAKSGRPRAALAAAKAKNRQLGRPSTVNEHQFRLVHEMAAAGKTHAIIAASTGLSKAVVGRVLRGEIASLDRFSRETEPGALPLFEESS